MKKLFSFLFAFALAFATNAQSHDGVYTVAIARNANGNILANTPIQLRYSIHDSVANGVVVYQETFSTTTSAQGMFNVIIGKGTVVSGNFSNINWGTNEKFVQTEMATNGNNFIDMGTTQMMSVPYALYAQNGVPKGNNAGDMLYWDGTVWKNVPAGQPGQIMVMGNNAPEWHSYINTTQVLTVGQSFQGGVIAYILQLGDIGYDPAIPHGLIVAPSNISTGSGVYSNYSFQWGCQGTTIGTSTDFGSGQANTTAIVNGCNQTPDFAAKLCDDLVLNGYSDWYLPSKDEYQKMSSVLYNLNVGFNVNLGGASCTVYWWTSSESSNANGSPWVYYPCSSQPFSNYYSKNSALYVHAIRSF